MPEHLRFCSSRFYQVLLKGLTRINEGLPESELEAVELEKVNQARQDIRMVKLRETVFSVVRSMVEIWSADAGVGHVRLLNLRLFFHRLTE